MNAFQRQILERKATDLVRFSNRSGSHMDTCLRFGTNETLAHLHKADDAEDDAGNRPQAHGAEPRDRADH